MFLSAGLLIGFFTGYFTRELKQFDRTDTIHNIKIVSTLPERKYVYEILSNHEQDRTQFCEDFDPKFPKDSVLEYVTFENRVSCWSVADKRLGYKYK